MPTQPHLPATSVSALDAFGKLLRGSRAMCGRLLPPLQRDFGLTESQLGVLEALVQRGTLSQGQICQQILKSGSNVTTVVDNLERDGLVCRVRDEQDRRVQIVHLTEKGRELVSRALPVHAERIARLMAVLTTAEQQELGRLSMKLDRGADD